MCVCLLLFVCVGEARSDRSFQCVSEARSLVWNFARDLAGILPERPNRFVFTSERVFVLKYMDKDNLLLPPFTTGPVFEKQIRK